MTVPVAAHPRTAPAPRDAAAAVRAAPGRWVMAAAVAALAGAAVALRLAYARRTLVYPYDAYYYLGTAQSLVDHASYSFRGFPHTRFLPLYPMVTALAGAVVGVERAGRLIPPFAWGAVVVLSYLLGRRLVSRGAGLVGAALLVAQPIGTKWTAVPMGESVFTLGLAGCLFAGVVALQDDRPRLWVTAGVLGGASALGRHEGLVTLPLLVVLMVAAARRSSWRRHLRPALVGLGLLLALPALWALRGVVVGGPDQSYAEEFSANLLTDVSMIWRRLRYFADDAWLNGWFAAAAWAGLALSILRPRGRLGGLVLGGWLAFFVVSHVGWYYVYERFVVPALPAAALLAGAAVVGAAEAAAWAARRARAPSAVAGVVAVVLATGVVGAVGATDLRTAAVLTDRHILELSDDWGGGVTRAAASALADHVEPGDAVATDSGALVAFYDRAPTYYLPFAEHQTVDRPDLTSTGVALLRDLRDRRVRWLVLRVPAGSSDVRSALLGLGLLNAGLRLQHRYAAPAVGPEGRPVEVAVFEVPPPRAPG